MSKTPLARGRHAKKGCLAAPLMFFGTVILVEELFRRIVFG